VGRYEKCVYNRDIIVSSAFYLLKQLIRDDEILPIVNLRVVKKIPLGKEQLGKHCNASAHAAALKQLQ
jgi:hypothetical protein